MTNSKGILRHHFDYGTQRSLLVLKFTQELPIPCAEGAKTNKGEMEIDSNQTLTIEQIRQNAFAQAYANVSALAVQSQHEVFFSQ